MKITAFNGSPWGQEGHTHMMTRDFAIGAVQAGARVRVVQLVNKKILPCNECGVCFYKTPGKCSIKDDMSNLIKKFMSSDVVIFATPVYIDNVSALMKIFIDRLLPVLEPYYEKDIFGKYRRRKRYDKYPKFLVISSCAMPDQNNFQVISLFFKRMARTMYTEICGEIYRSTAGVLLLSKQDIKFKPMVNKYRELLQETGRRFAKTGKIEPQMAARLDQPLVNTQEYVEYANKMWNQLLTKPDLLNVLA